MKNKLVTVFGAASLSLLLLTSCSGGSNYGAVDDSYTASTAGVSNIDTYSLADNSGAAETKDFLHDSSDQEAENTEYKPNADTDNSQSTTQQESSDVKLSNDKIVYRADLEIKTSSFDKSNKSLEEMLNKYEAVIQSRNYYIRDHIRICEINLRVPATNFDVMMEEAGSIGKVINSNIASENITQKYLDVQSHINSKTLRINRLKELISKADSISELSELYSELEDAEYDLDSLKSQLKNMDLDVAYSYINIRLNDTHRYNDDGEEVGTGSWISNRLYDLWNSLRLFRNFLNGILIAVIYILPYSLLILFILFIAVKLEARKKLTEIRKKRAEKEAERKKSVIQIAPKNSDTNKTPDVNIEPLTSETYTNDKNTDNNE